MQPQTIIFVGRSGAGKGTQSEILKKYFAEQAPEVPLLYIETGSYFRKYMHETGNTWDRVRAMMERGERQPDFIAVWMWVSALIQNLKGGEHIIFDGAPRAVAEAHILDTVFPFYGRKKPTVVFLNVSEEWAEERLRGRGRADDLLPEVVLRRFAFFEKDVVPVIEFYRRALGYDFVELDGERTPGEIHADIVKHLTK